MDPMLDPDLIEFMDDASLLAAFEMVRTAPDDGGHGALIAELRRRDLGPATAPTLAIMADTNRRTMPLRL